MTDTAKSVQGAPIPLPEPLPTLPKAELLELVAGRLQNLIDIRQSEFQPGAARRIFTDSFLGLAALVAEPLSSDEDCARYADGAGLWSRADTARIQKYQSLEANYRASLARAARKAA